MDGSLWHERIQMTDVGFNPEAANGAPGDVILCEHDELGRVVLEVVARALSAKTRVYQYA